MSAATSLHLPVWNPETFGTTEHPAHKSDFISYTHCAARHFYRQEAKAAAAPQKVRVFGIDVGGTAVHETIREVLPAVIAGEEPDPTEVKMTYWRHFEARRKAEGAAHDRDIIWPKDRPAHLEHRRNVAEMVYFLMAAPKKIRAIVAAEAPFRATLHRKDGTPIETAGIIDLLFLDHEGKFCLGDFKSGKKRPSQWGLNYGYELGLYAAACRYGYFDVGSVGKVYGRFPDHSYLIILGDFLPMAKDASRKISMADEARFFGKRIGQSATIKKGTQRGPGWYEGMRREAELEGTIEAMWQVVAAVRGGNATKVLDERCSRCAFRDRCVTEAFGPSESEAAEIAEQIAELGDDAERLTTYDVD